VHISAKWILGGYVTLAMSPFQQFLRSPVHTVPGNMLVKFEVCTLIVTILEQLAFNVQKFRGSHDHGYVLFSKNFKGFMCKLSLGTCLSNLKVIHLTMLAFNAPKFRGHLTMAMPFYRKIFKGLCPDCPWEHASHI